MLQFVDSFECLRSRENGTMIIHLMQREPSIDASDDKAQSVVTSTNKIASVVMEVGTALDLYRSMGQLFQSSGDAVAESNLDTAIESQNNV